MIGTAPPPSWSIRVGRQSVGPSFLTVKQAGDAYSYQSATTDAHAHEVLLLLPEVLPSWISYSTRPARYRFHGGTGGVKIRYPVKGNGPSERARKPKG
jgi:hypothetical protein